jgi:hypothetical protein
MCGSNSLTLSFNPFLRASMMARSLVKTEMEV